ncbi:MAG: restriction endonuclease subunit S [Candidatus Xenobium sp.]|jgi:type I restriction enzyme S subunit|nr:hypothetical protein [Burkholderiales bacterium]
MEGELPEGWIWTTLGEVVDRCESTDPRATPTKSFKYIDIGSIDNQSHRIGEAKAFLGAEAPSRARRIVQASDVLFSTVRPYLKNIAKVPEELAGELTSTGICVLRSSAAIDTGFLFQSVVREEFIRSVSASMDGTMYPAVRDADVLAQSIPLPPLNEQRRIVARLEELSARTKAARAALEAIPPLLERFRQSVLAAAFRGDLTAEWRARNPDVEPASELLKRIRAERRRLWEEAELAKMRAKGKVPRDDRWKARYVEPESVNAEGLPELPEGWVWIRMGEAGLWRTGGTPARNVDFYFGGHIPWVKTGDLTDGPILNIEETLTHEGIQNSNAEVCPPGTLLVAMYGATIGKLGMLVEPAATNQACAALLPDDNSPVHRKFLFWYIYAQRGNLRRLGQGGAQPNISQALLKNFSAPIPPPQEQLTILEILETMNATSLALEDDVSRAHQSLTTLHQALLAKAFRGELVPQDPEDEPASVLLERIRKERAAAEKAGKAGNKKRARKAR